MKATLLFISIAGFFITSCSTGNQLKSSAANDDLYLATTEPGSQGSVAYAEEEPVEVYQDGYSNPEPDYTTTEKYVDENGTSYITNNYYEGQNYDFYGSDYSYTSELNRWYGPSVGFSYYSPFYTSPGFGISFGIGFGWGYPYYYPYYSSFYNPYYYNPWYSPYYYGYYPYYNPYYYGGCYGGGYYGGGYCGGGYYDGYGYGYGNDYYYGPRSSSSSNTSGNGGRSYKADGNVNGDEQGIGGTSGRALIPVSLDQSDNLNQNESPVKITGAAGETGEIRRNVTSQGSSLSGTGTVKDLPGRNTGSSGNDNEIKSVVPPVRVNPQAPAPSRQNTDLNRPRTSASSPEFEQQREANAAINAVNIKSMSAQHDAPELTKVSEGALVKKTGSDSRFTTNVKSPVASMPSKGSVTETKKVKSLLHDQPSKTNQHTSTKVQSQRAAPHNSNSSNKSYSQGSSSRSSSSASSRSSSNRPPR